MGYGMKYTKGGFPFKASPAKNNGNVDLTKKTGLGPRAIENVAQGNDAEVEAREDAKGVGSGSNRKVMNDGKKNNAVYKGKVVKGNWEPHQFLNQ